MLKVVASSGREISKAMANAIARIVKREFKDVPTVLVTTEELSEEVAIQIAQLIHQEKGEGELGDLVQICVTDADLEEGGPIIMSRSNPCGYSFEYLISQLKDDLKEKIGHIDGDHSMAAEIVRENNTKIMGLLGEVDQLYQQSRTNLSRFSSDPGPTGTPRIGLPEGDEKVVESE